MPSFQTAQRSANEHDSIGNTFSKTTPACVCRARLVAPDVSAGTSAFVAALRRAVALARSRTRPVVSGGVARRFRSDRRLDLACASTLRVRTDRARRLSAAAHLEAAGHIDLRSLRPQALRVAVLAIGGTVVTALAIACAISGGRVTICLSAGARRDRFRNRPVAVIAVFRNIAVPVRVKALVEAESLSNDGIAVVIYGMAMVQATGSLAWLPALGRSGGDCR